MFLAAWDRSFRNDNGTCAWSATSLVDVNTGPCGLTLPTLTQFHFTPLTDNCTPDDVRAPHATRSVLTSRGRMPASSVRAIWSCLCLVQVHSRTLSSEASDGGDKDCSRNAWRLRCIIVCISSVCEK